MEPKNGIALERHHERLFFLNTWLGSIWQALAGKKYKRYENLNDQLSKISVYLIY